MILIREFFFMQLEEPILLLGKERFEGVDIRVRVKGGGHVSQVYGKRILKLGGREYQQDSSFLHLNST